MNHDIWCSRTRSLVALHWFVRVGQRRIVSMTSALKTIFRFFAAIVIPGLALAPAPAVAQRPLGIDVSHFQGSITWPSVKSAGYSFAWAKATEGVTFNDSFFGTNETNAVAAGVLIGAYHFARPENNLGLAGADAEAAHFWGVVSNYVGNGGYYLMPMLDVESDLTNIPPYTQATLSQWVNQWCNDIVNYAAAKGVTVKPVI